MAPSAILKVFDSPEPAALKQTSKALPTTIVHATPITELAFAPYGGLIAAGLQLPSVITFPNARKSVEVVPTTNLYAQAPSGVPGRHVLHVEAVETKVPDPKTRTLVLERMERHPFTAQAFIPMGSDVGYLAIVANGNAAGDAPDLSTLKVFTVGEGQGVCYDAGVWHASMHVISKVSPV